MHSAKLMRLIKACAIAFVAFPISSYSQPKPAPTQVVGYDISEIGTFGGTISQVFGLNDAGLTSGWAETAHVDPTGCFGDGSLIFRGYRYNGSKLNQIGTFGGNNSQSNAINQLGFAAGFAETSYADPNFPPCLTSHAFLYRHGKLTDIGVVGNGNNSQALGLNDSSQVVGFSENGEFDPNFGFPLIHAFSWSGGNLSDLPTLGGANAAAGAVNQSGLVLGFSDTSTDIDPLLGFADYHAVLWRNGNIIDMGTLGGTVSGIGTAGSGLPFFTNLSFNSAGQVTGYSQTSAASSDPVPLFTNFTPVPPGALVNEVHAFLWYANSMHDLKTLGGGFSEGTALNKFGHAAGISTLDHTPDPDNEVWFGVDFPKIHAALWRGGHVVDLGTLGGPVAQSFAINDHDQVVGWSVLSDNQSVDAFLWQCGTLFDLNSLIDPASDWVLIQATQINNKGQIAGFGLHHGQARAFLLTPSSNRMLSSIKAIPLNARNSRASDWVRHASPRSRYLHR